jgi:hypothetical protein
VRLVPLLAILLEGFKKILKKHKKLTGIDLDDVRDRWAEESSEAEHRLDSLIGETGGAIVIEIVMFHHVPRAKGS